MANAQAAAMKKKRKLFSIANGFDMPFLIILMLILVIGLVCMYSASYAYAFYWYDGDSYYFIKRQLAFAAALAAMNAPIRYVFSAMQEPLHYALMLAVLGCGILARRDKSRAAWAGLCVLCAVATLVRPYEAVLWLFPLALCRQDRRRIAVCVAGGAVSLGGTLVLMSKFYAPYFFTNVDLSPLQGLARGQVVSAVRDVAHKLLDALRTVAEMLADQLANRSGGQYLLFFLLLGVTLVCLIVDARAGRPVFWKGCAAVTAVIVFLALLLMYRPVEGSRHTLVLDVLLLAALLVEDARPAAGTAAAALVLAALGVLGILNVLRSYGVYLSWWWFEELFYPTGLALGGVGLLLGSRSMQRRARRFGKYLACAGKRRVVPIAELAQAAEVSERKAEKDLELMVEKGLWGEGAYVDAGGDMLFRSQEDAEAYRIDRRAAEEPAEPTQAEEGYSGVLRSIRRANDRIADPVLSQKIDRLEEIAGRIFRIIEDEPSKRAQASTFLNYYLPTTQKLLDSYADFEEAGVSGKNLDQAKDKIARTMDNIVAGFEQQLDRLYQSEAMDIDSDIRVMETMLRRDRGTVEDDFGLGGGTAVQPEDEKF